MHTFFWLKMKACITSSACVASGRRCIIREDDFRDIFRWYTERKSHKSMNIIFRSERFRGFHPGRLVPHTNSSFIPIQSRRRRIWHRPVATGPFPPVVWAPFSPLALLQTDAWRHWHLLQHCGAEQSPRSKQTPIDPRPPSERPPRTKKPFRQLRAY